MIVYRLPHLEGLKNKALFYKYTGANRQPGWDIFTRLCVTLARVTCVTLSKLNGGDNSYLRDSGYTRERHAQSRGNVLAGLSVRTGEIWDS